MRKLTAVQKADGMNYAPKGKAAPVVGPGDFPIAAVGLDHGHVYGMCNGLVEAGAEIRLAFDPDPDKVQRFLDTYPQAKAARSKQAVLDDPAIKLIVSSCVPCDRGPLGVEVMLHGKDYFVDKAPLITLEHLAAARAKAAETGQKYFVYYGERLHSECSIYAGNLIAEGAIGRVLQVIGLGPHRLAAATRPAWFFERESYGGILIDIGSHQIEQFLHFAGAQDAQVVSSRVANYANKQYPELEDFGDATLTADNGATNYFRVDWFTPAGLGAWGDGRATIMGTDGYIELRKYLDIARDSDSDQLYLVNGKQEKRIPTHNTVGFPFFGQLILDCLNRTENAMTQERAFRVAELSLIAQQQAIRIEA